MPIIELDSLDLFYALVPIAVAIALSRWQQLGLEGTIVVAVGRTILQLGAVGYLLELVFAIDHPLPVLGIFLLMAAIASVVTRNRVAPKLPFVLPIAGGSLVASGALTVAYIIFAVVQPPIWYRPQYFIPLARIILGNAANSATLAGERLVGAMRSDRAQIETHLSLGATPRQATASYRRTSIRASLIPTLNQLMLAGVVTLPGIFSGQVLSGVPPLDAASYQILVLLAIAFTNLIAACLMVEGIYRQFFNRAYQLRQ